MTEERTWQWRYRYECPMAGCGSGDNHHFASPDEAMAAFRDHLAGSHSSVRRIKVDWLYLPVALSTVIGEATPSWPAPLRRARRSKPPSSPNQK